ncbi:hypothetical protein SAMN06296058_1049 [Pseudoxanthomonas indica]|uniref:Uncharacterized protein n=1 Tax=Pseudoxanthomonas indica TaxID=428993 RepID=A0A1T5JSU6_9GAMM|nr:hypothetical protein SAMN06296058_1049 [Pseudoxanthomonas indica]
MWVKGKPAEYIRWLFSWLRCPVADLRSCLASPSRFGGAARHACLLSSLAGCFLLAAFRFPLSACCLLFAVCCLLFAVCSLLFAVCCPWVMADGLRGFAWSGALAGPGASRPPRCAPRVRAAGAKFRMAHPVPAETVAHPCATPCGFTLRQHRSERDPQAHRSKQTGNFVGMHRNCRSLAAQPSSLVACWSPDLLPCCHADLSVSCTTRPASPDSPDSPDRPASPDSPR